MLHAIKTYVTVDSN